MKKYERLQEIDKEIAQHEKFIAEITLTQRDRDERTPLFLKVQEHAKEIDELIDEQSRLNRFL